MAPKKNAKLDGDEDGNIKVQKDETPPQVGDKREHSAVDEEDSKQNKAAKTHDDGQQPAAANEKSAELKPGKTEQDEEGKGDFKVLEQGLIYFFYRPKVKSADEVDDGKPAAESIDDIQNAHMLLIPAESDSSTAPAKSSSNGDGGANLSASTGELARRKGVGFRLVRLGKKRLPAPEEAIKQGLEPGGIGGDSSEAIWACVSDVGQSVTELSGTLGEKRYETRTRGSRVVGAARPAGRGRYSIVHHEIEPPSAQSVHLAFALSHPTHEEFGDVQKDLGLAPSASIRLSMRNPTTPETGSAAPPAGLPNDQRAEMTADELDEAFGGAVGSGGNRYGNPVNLHLLDRTGVELLLTRERHQDGIANAGNDQTAALEKLARKEAKKLNVNAVLNELQLSNENPPDALEGAWI